MPRAATLDSARGKYLLSSTRFDDLDQALGNSRVTLLYEEERVSMDLRKEEGTTVLRKLLQVSDVLVQNFRPRDHRGDGPRLGSAQDVERG